MQFHLIILAAGLSRRYGEKHENKLLAELNGQPMYMHVVEKLLNIKASRSDVEDLTLITRRGPIYDKWRGDPRLLCVENPHPEEGISTSLHLALESVGNAGQEPQAIVCFVADQPYMKESTITQFMDAFDASDKPMGAIRCDGATYNPCVFRNDCWPALKELTGDTGGKQLIRRNPDGVYYYELAKEDAREVEDIDYKA